MSIDRNQIVTLVLASITMYADELGENFDLSEGEHTRLIGGNSPLDSLGLVSLIVAIEESIEETWGISLTLADERAMSRRTSPFARVGLLVDYIEELISQNQSNDQQ